MKPHTTGIIIRPALLHSTTGRSTQLFGCFALIPIRNYSWLSSLLMSSEMLARTRDCYRPSANMFHRLAAETPSACAVYSGSSKETCGYCRPLSKHQATTAVCTIRSKAMPINQKTKGNTLQDHGTSCSIRSHAFEILYMLKVEHTV